MPYILYSVAFWYGGTHCPCFCYCLLLVFPLPPRSYCFYILSLLPLSVHGNVSLLIEVTQFLLIVTSGMLAA